MELTAKSTNEELSEYYSHYEKDRPAIINRLVRNYNLVGDSSDNRMVQHFSSILYRSISNNTDISLTTVQDIIDKFLKHALNFKKFLRSCTINWTHTPPKLYKKARIYLHKIHKVAPIFHYKRAKTNLKSLHKFFEREQFWPKISTQLAIVVFITDLLDKSEQFSRRLIQKNLRVLCDCSAYAFHRTRNKMKDKNILPQ